MALAFDYTDSSIHVTGQTSVDVQVLVNAIRTEEASETGITYPAILDASGKADLGNSIYTGITASLIDWQLEFEAGAYSAVISGGNLVGGVEGNPVAYSSGVQVKLIQSAAGTLTAVGGSALTSEEHAQLMALSNGLTTSQGTQLTAIHAAHMNRRKRDSGTQVITIYEEDGTTPFAEFDSNADLSEITPR